MHLNVVLLIGIWHKTLNTSRNYKAKMMIGEHSQYDPALKLLSTFALSNALDTVGVVAVGQL